jgi:hypothetical protein
MPVGEYQLGGTGPVASETALGQLPIQGLPDGYVLFVQVTKTFWRLDLSSGAVAVAGQVVVAFGGATAARWILTNVGAGVAGQSVATLPLLTTNVDDTQLPDATWIWVTSCECYFQLLKTSTDGTVSRRIVATKSGNGRWERVIASTSFSWGQQAAWYIDAVNGDDDNTGKVGFPIKTGTELQLRLPRNTKLNGGNSVTIHILSGAPDLLFFALGDHSNIAIIGEGPTTVFSGTLTSAVALNRAGNTATVIQASGLSGSWTALGGLLKRIRLTSGATLGTAWIAVDDGTANKQAQTTPFLDAAGHTFTPAGTETFVVESLTQLSSLQIEWSDSWKSLFVSLTDVELKASSNTNIANVFLLGVGSLFSDALLTAYGESFVELLGCQVAGISAADSAIIWAVGGLRTGAAIVQRESAALYYETGDAYVLNATLFTNDAQARSGNVFVNNTTAGRIRADLSVGGSKATQGGALICDAVGTGWTGSTGGVLYGVIAGAATDGMLLGRGARVDLGGNTPTFTTTGAGWVFGSATKAHGGLPFVDQFNIGAGAVANSNMAQVFT